MRLIASSDEAKLTDIMYPQSTLPLNDQNPNPNSKIVDENRTTIMKMWE